MKRLGGSLIAIWIVVTMAPTAGAQDCARAVILTIPGVTWADVRAVDPPEITEMAEAGAIGSVSVRTISSRTSLGSGFASLGAGGRVEAGTTTGGPALDADSDAASVTNLPVAGVADMRKRLDAAGYSTIDPGALGESMPEGASLVAVGNADLGAPPPVPLGYGRWSLLAAMDADGVVDLAFTGPDLVETTAGELGVETNDAVLKSHLDEALDDPCASIVVDHGDLSRLDHLERRSQTRSDAEFGEALLDSDGLLDHIRARLDPSEDLLIVISPTTPAWDKTQHFGVALAEGPGFTARTELTSPTTQRAGIVTLPDVAPTVLAHLGAKAPGAMLGRAWGTSPGDADRINSAIALDVETGFIDAIRTPISTIFVLVQIALYLMTLLLLFRSERGAKPELVARRALEIGGLALAAFPVVTYLAGLVSGHELGDLLYSGLLVALDVVVVGVALWLGRGALDRLLIVAAITVGVFFLDLLTGATLQLNTVLSYSPIVAGRFSGVGNIAFAVLAAASVLLGTLLVHRFGGKRSVLVGVATLFLATIVLDGAPQFGSDVGGALALVPGLAVCWVLLSGRRPSLRALVVIGLAGLIATGGFLALDLSRPPEDRTHLGRLYEDIRSEGTSVLTDTITRKVRTQVRVARSTIWTFVVPPALALVAILLLKPRGRWKRLATTHPTIASGLLGALVVAVLGFMVNDSGIVVPAMMFSYLVPVALLAHLSRFESSR